VWSKGISGVFCVMFEASPRPSPLRGEGARRPHPSPLHEMEREHEARARDEGDRKGERRGRGQAPPLLYMFRWFGRGVRV
jgi:hypothetical protein